MPVRIKKTARSHRSNVGLNIKALRCQYGISQKELGDRIGRNREFINRVERTGNIDLVEAVKIAECLATTGERLVKGEFWKILEG